MELKINVARRTKNERIIQKFETETQTPDDTIQHKTEYFRTEGSRVNFLINNSDIVIIDPYENTDFIPNHKRLRIIKVKTIRISLK